MATAKSLPAFHHSSNRITEAQFGFLLNYLYSAGFKCTLAVILCLTVNLRRAAYVSLSFLFMILNLKPDFFFVRRYKARATRAH